MTFGCFNAISLKLNPTFIDVLSGLLLVSVMITVDLASS